MFQLLIFCSALASFAVASCITANQPNDNGAVIELPKLPVYPADGKIPPALKNRFVFLDGQNNYKMIVTLPAKNSTRTVVGRMTLNIGVCPSLTNEIKKNGADFEYEYQLTNLPAAHQPLSRWVQPLPFKVPVKLLAVARSSGWMGSEANPDESIRSRNIDYLKDVTKSVDTNRVNSVIQRKIDWFSLVNPGLAPGATVQPYRMRTKALPGIVVMYFEGDAVTTGNSSWPPDMLDQVLAMYTTENDSVSLLTVGPKFDPGANRANIAKDYFTVIDGAIKQKRLRTSPFLQEAMSRLMSGAAHVTPWASKPVTPLEKQISWGIELSLD
jgi:hypothetical protein